FTASGFVLGQDARVITGALATSATATSDVGDYVITDGGLAAANYVIAADQGTLAIDPARLTVKIADQSRTYGSSAFDGRGFAASGFVLGQDARVITGALATSATATSDVGDYVITGGGLTAKNYVIAADPGTLAIDPARLTVAIADQSRTYGSSAFDGRGFTASGFVLGQDARVITGALATSATATSDVGDYAITGGGLAAANYVIAADPGTLAIDPARLTVKIADQSRTYGSSAFDGRGFTASGFVLGQDASVIAGALATEATAGSDVGDYGIIQGTLAAANYVISSDPGNLAINPAELRVKIADQSRTYGSAKFDGRGFTATGFVLGQDAGVIDGRLATRGTSTSNVGRYAITRGTLAAENYVIAADPGTLTIDPAQMRVRANDARRAYGASNPRFDVSYLDPFAPGQSAAALGWRPTVSTPATAGSDVGAYVLTPGGIASANYAIEYLPGRLTIDPVRLNLTLHDAERNYGAEDPVLGWTASGFVLGQGAEVVSGAPATDATGASGAGTYTITTGTLGARNYVLPETTGRLTITPAPLTVTASDAARAQGARNPDFTARFDGFVRGEGLDDLGGALVLATDADRTSPAGRYAITGSGLASGNYAISYAPGTLTVSAAGPARAPLAAVDDAFVIPERGLPPYTPGDSAFRTTRSEAPIARDSTFRLTYSLGAVVHTAPVDAAETGGFVPAAGSASGGSGPTGVGTSAGAGCGGAGAEGGCARTQVAESFWTTAFPEMTR
uniref:MBG domain-containing protein n=1 Tax=Amaricoccus sp. TaxID=1872485 RepID=UPI001B53C8DA